MNAAVARVSLFGASALTALGVYRAVDAAASSIKGDGTVDSIIPLVILMVAMLCVTWLRRGVQPGRPRPISWRRYIRWSLACIMPLMLLSAGKAPFTGTYEESRQNIMRSDLRDLVAAEEKASADSGHFTSHPAIAASAGVTQPDIRITSDGWTAQVVPVVTSRICAVYIGETPLPPARVEGEPRCSKAPLRTAEIIQGLVVIFAGLAAGSVIVLLNPSRRVRVSPGEVSAVSSSR